MKKTSDRKYKLQSMGENVVIYNLSLKLTLMEEISIPFQHSTEKNKSNMLLFREGIKIENKKQPIDYTKANAYFIWIILH